MSQASAAVAEPLDAPRSIAHTLGAEEVDALRHLVAREGEPRVLLALGLSRLTLARLLARMSVRAGTIVLVRSRLVACEALLARLGGRQRRAAGNP